MYDFIRVSCCVPAIEVADVTGNCEKIESQLRKAAKDGSTVAVFPELCLSGYTCNDLFQQEILLEQVKEELKNLGSCWRTARRPSVIWPRRQRNWISSPSSAPPCAFGASSTTVHGY